MIAATPALAAVPCPVCGLPTRRWFKHPDAEIQRCSNCRHIFSRLDSIRAFEAYDAAYYEATHRNWFLHPNTNLFQWLERAVPGHATSLIDVGCGNGDFLRFLGQRRTSLRLVGLDLSTPGPAEPFERLEGDVLTTRFEEQFDVVTSLAVIEHVADVAQFVGRLHDLCRPGGTVAVMTLNASGLLYAAAGLGRRVGIRIASDRLYSRHHLHHFTKASLASLLRSVDLEIVQTHHHNAPLAAMDLPVSGRAARQVLLGGVAACFGVGRLVRRGYLQTVVCRRPDQRAAAAT